MSKRLRHDNASSECLEAGPQRRGTPSGDDAAPQNEGPASAKDPDRVARGRQLGLNNSKAAKKMRCRGTTAFHAHAPSLAFPSDEEGHTASHFGTSRVVVLRHVLHAAQQPSGGRRGETNLQKADAAHWKELEGHVRDVPRGMEDTEYDHPDRLSYQLTPDSAIAKALDSRLDALRAALQVKVIARVGLKSKGGASAQRQAGHYDFHPRKMAEWHAAQRQRRERLTYGWTLLTSLQNGGMLNVFCDGRWVVVRLAAGDAALFRSDVWHGGAMYARPHFRVHEYWQPTAADEFGLRLTDDGQLDIHAVEGKVSWTESHRRVPCVEYTGAGYDVGESLPAVLPAIVGVLSGAASSES